MDSSIATEPAFKLVARTLGVDWKTVVGSCYLVWLACYERRSERLRVVEADLAAELDGFSRAMIDEDLAVADGDAHVVFRGVRRRIEFLVAQAERGSKGGKRKGVSIRSARQANAVANAQAKAIATAQADTLDLDPALSLDQSPAPSPTQDPKEPPFPPTGGSPVGGVKGGSKPKAKRNGITPDERAIAERVLAKLRERSGRDYRSDVHVEAVVHRLRDGNSERDCKLVVWDRANRWAGDPKMDEYVRPATLFGRTKFADYLAEAKAAWDEVEREKELEEHAARTNAPPSALVAGALGGKLS